MILMHNRRDRNYTNLIEDVKRDLLESVEIARVAGVQDHHILLDPGIGFAKDYDENMKVMASLDQLVGLGFPVRWLPPANGLSRPRLALRHRMCWKERSPRWLTGLPKVARSFVCMTSHMKRTAKMCDAMTYASTELRRI